jgi:hypothetical protein
MAQRQENKLVSAGGAGRSTDMVDCVAEIGLHPACNTQITEARELAADLIGPDIATAETLRAVQAFSWGSVLVAEDSSGVAGVLATLRLCARGRAAVECGRFDGVRIDLELLSGPGETPAAFYAWGAAARGRDAARSVVAGAAGLTRLFSFIPRFARAATAAGARTLTERMGYLPAAGSPDLFWLPPEAAS